ncbi:MAG: gamma-glutamyl-gamma-aminobutyrate hydrolase family protein [Myxococcales bacterium]|nr:gamma-glutamyl-gamma-aminobutyrate hydrolase family protein [Myxococcales bacterium]
MRPFIGIPLGLDDRGRWNPARDYQYIDSAYARAVADCGGDAVALPIQERAEALVERIDGLLIPGGDDFAPPRAYPQGVVFDPAPERQIEFDRRLLAHALGRNLPVLAICYGMQLLALHFGGALVYDIPTDRPDAGPHRLPERDGRHGVRVETGTRLAAAVGETPEPVNSRHHQAVAEPGGSMRVSARAKDGLIEAIEREAAGFCVGVQWHPERMRGRHREGLFGAFVAACAERRPA